MNNRSIPALFLFVLTAFPAAAPAAVAAGAVQKSFNGNVSWYGSQFHGKRTASGEIFDMNEKTAAHRKLPFSTKVLVEDPQTGNAVIVKVNDRGPYAKNRVLDLSKGAARKMAMLGRGVIYAECMVIN